MKPSTTPKYLVVVTRSTREAFIKTKKYMEVYYSIDDIIKRYQSLAAFSALRIYDLTDNLKKIPNF